MQIGEITPSTTGNQDLLCDALCALKNGYATAAFARLDGAHQPGRSGSQNDYIEGFSTQVSSFELRVGCCQSSLLRKSAEPRVRLFNGKSNAESERANRRGLYREIR